MSIDDEIVDTLEKKGIDFACSVPCNMLAGVLRKIETSSIQHIPVTREEEGVGICAGAYLGGKKPALIMQNSGFGNCINALLSLTRLYEMPLLLLMSHRGDVDEKIVAQIPMGKAVPNLLETLGIEYVRTRKREEIMKIGVIVDKAFRDNDIKAVLLSRELWDEED
jgi:sulfopyruvate decarboxylase subunit alpha